MEQSTYLNISQLSEEARRELKAFYHFLLFKYQDSGKKEMKGKSRLENFLSNPIEVKNFISFSREERNER